MKKISELPDSSAANGNELIPVVQGGVTVRMVLSKIKDYLLSFFSAPAGASLIGYTPEGTGAVPTTVQTKLRGIVSVKDFGAVGDGVHDDTAAIQAAIDAGKPYSSNGTAGRMIFFPAGKYKVSSISLNDCHGINLCGAGKQATEIFTYGTNPVISGIGSSSSTINGVSIQSMTIRGGGKTNPNAHGIDLQWANRCTLKDLLFFGCRNALNLYHQWQTTLSDIHIIGSGTDQNYIGVYLGPTNSTYIDNAVQAVNVFVQGTSGYGFRIVNGQGSKFTNCEAGGSPMIHAWYIGDPPSGTVPCQWIHFENCLGDSTTAAAWLFRQGTASEISQMQLANCWAGNGDYGFYFDGCKHIVAGNLLAVGNTKSGVVIHQCEYVTVSNSQFIDNNEAALSSVGDIQISGGNYNVITGNLCASNPAGKSLLEISTDNNNIMNNIFFRGATITGPNSVVYRNRGFLTENRGSAQIAAGSTSVVVPHGLGITPTADHVRITPRDPMGSASKFWVNNVTATSFTINVNTAPGATITFGWAIDLVRL